MCHATAKPVAVGGDGMYNEVLSALVLRHQRECGTNIDSIHARLQAPHIAIGCVPAGSTNTLVHYYLHMYVKYHRAA